MTSFEPPAPPTAPRTVTVTGVASVRARPDRATISLGVEVRRPAAGEAMEVAAQRATALVAALKDAGVAEEHLRTTGINLWHDQHERTYVASQQLAATVPADGVGAHIDAAARAAGGELTMHGVSFSVSEPAALVAPLRAAALADARAKASALAEAEGATAGAALAITEGGGGGHVPLFKAARAEAMLADMPVEAGAETLTLSVTVTYELR